MNISSLKLCLIFLLLFCSCSKDQSLLEDSIVNIVYPIGGLGDQSFVDNIFEGVVSSKYEHQFELHHFFPENHSLAIDIIDSLISIGSNSKELLILADGTYGRILDSYDKEMVNKRILLLDGTSQKDIWTVEFSFYGAAYLAGVAAARVSKSDTVAFIAGMPLQVLMDCYKGFSDGFISKGGNFVELHYLHTTPLGFEMINEAEQLTRDLLKHTDLVVGAAGGSNMGIFNVLRGKSEKYAIGIDSDQSHFAPDAVIGSITKNVGSVLNSCLNDIDHGGYTIKNELLDLKSGYTDFVVNSLFVQILGNSVENARQEAILKEEIILNEN